VKSATHSRFGAPAANCRFTRSDALSASGSDTVVRTAFPRTAPVRPSPRMSRSTRARPTGIPSRFNAHHTFRAPYTE
jgi:hypothetical protein